MVEASEVRVDPPRPIPVVPTWILSRVAAPEAVVNKVVNPLVEIVPPLTVRLVVEARPLPDALIARIEKVVSPPFILAIVVDTLGEAKVVVVVVEPTAVMA